MVRSPTRRRVLEAAGGLAAVIGLAGCSGGGGDSTPTAEPTLSVAEFVFCASRPDGYDAYERQPDATYAVDDTIWVYLDIVNIGSADAGEDAIKIDLTETLEVIGPDGESVLSKDIDFDNEFGAGVDLRTFFLVNDIHLPGNASGGEYEVTVELTDHIESESTTASGTFTAEA